jgi:hypothetical protein
MDQAREKVALEEQLARCRQLAGECPTGITALNIRALIEDLVQEILAQEQPKRD